MSFPARIIVILVSLFFIFVPVFAFAQDSSDVEVNSGESEYTVINNIDTGNLDPNKNNRIAADIGFSLLYDAILETGGMVLIASGILTGELDEGSTGCGMFASGIMLMSASIIAPALAVHSSHSIFGGQGSLGWAYGGSIIGSLLGAGIGALGFADNSRDAYLYGFIGTTVFSFIFGTLGAILGYELTNMENLERSHSVAITNLHPVIEISEERKVFGVGFDF